MGGDNKNQKHKAQKVITCRGIMGNLNVLWPFQRHWDTASSTGTQQEGQHLGLCKIKQQDIEGSFLSSVEGQQMGRTWQGMGVKERDHGGKSPGAETGMCLSYGMLCVI